MAIQTNLVVKPEFQQLLHDLCSDEQDRVDGGCNAIQQGIVDLKTWVARSDRENASPELLNLIFYVAMYAQPRFQAGIFNIILEVSPEARSEIDREFRYHRHSETAITVLYIRSCEKEHRAFDDGMSALLHARADILSAPISLRKEHLLHHAIFLSAAASPVVTDVTHFPLKLTRLVIEYIGGVRARNNFGRLQANTLEEVHLRCADPEVLELYASLGFNPLSERCHCTNDVLYSTLPNGGFFSPLHPRIALLWGQLLALQRGFQASIPFLGAKRVAQLIPAYEKIGAWYQDRQFNDLKKLETLAWCQESLAKLTTRQVDWLPAATCIDSLPTALISTVVQSRTSFFRPLADLVASYVKGTASAQRPNKERQSFSLFHWV